MNCFSEAPMFLVEGPDRIFRKFSESKLFVNKLYSALLKIVKLKFRHISGKKCSDNLKKVTANLFLKFYKYLP